MRLLIAGTRTVTSRVAGCGVVDPQKTRGEVVVLVVDILRTAAELTPTHAT